MQVPGPAWAGPGLGGPAWPKAWLGPAGPAARGFLDLRCRPPAISRPAFFCAGRESAGGLGRPAFFRLGRESAGGLGRPAFFRLGRESVGGLGRPTFFCLARESAGGLADRVWNRWVGWPACVGTCRERQPRPGHRPAKQGRENLGWARIFPTDVFLRRSDNVVVGRNPPDPFPELGISTYDFSPGSRFCRFGVEFPRVG